MWQERRCNHQRQIVAARNNKARDAAKGMAKHSSKALQKPSPARPQTLQNRGWGGPGEAKFAQEASETRKERPTSVQEGPKSCLRSAQESPRAAQERPRAGQEALGRCRNFSKILFGALQILICTRSWPNCLFEKLSGRFLFVFCVMRWMVSTLRCAFRTTPASVL